MNKKSALRLVGACYGLAIFGLLAMTLFNFLYDSILFATKQIQTQEFTTSQMNLKDFVLEDDASLTSTSPDPQILLEKYNKNAVKLVLDMKCSKYPGEVTLYYTRKEKDEYSVNKKVFATQNKNGEYEFIMPRGKLANIRVDPTNFSEVNVQFNKFTLNPKRSFANYFAYNGEVIFNIVIWPGLVGALAAWIVQACKSSSKVMNFLKKSKNAEPDSEEL